MKILLLGKNGQVGWELQRSLAPIGELVALSSASTEYCGDLNNLEGLAQTVRDLAPDVIVNAAAYTAVDKAEEETGLAQTVNALAPAVLAKEAKRIGALLIHYSTDYVFDGSGDRHWTETDKTEPLSMYGKTKLEGEVAIREAGCQHLIFRTSWVYAARGVNFARTMLRLAQEREQLNVVDDQYGAPTGAELLADVTAHCILHARRHPDVCGVYHVAAGGVTSWYEYACYVIEFARSAGLEIKVAADSIKPVPAGAYPQIAPRPRNSRLETTKFQNCFGLNLPDWHVGVNRMLTEFSESKK